MIKVKCQKAGDNLSDHRGDGSSLYAHFGQAAETEDQNGI